MYCTTVFILLYSKLIVQWKINKLIKLSHAKTCCSLRHHHLDKFLVVDLPIAINISLTDHLIGFLVGKFLAEVGHHMAQFSSRDETVAVFVKDFECFHDLFLRVRILHLPCHHGKKLREVNGAIAICIDQGESLLELSNLFFGKLVSHLVRETW